jgi:protein-S-isoprenylcysteine O-methyltransferase Ste14
VVGGRDAPFNNQVARNFSISGPSIFFGYLLSRKRMNRYIQQTRAFSIKREWLFADPKQMLQGLKKLTLRSGQILMFIFIGLVSLTPLPTQPLGITLIGLGLYVTGTVLVLVSIHFFGLAPADQPVFDGPYRFSRNPQWVGLFFVLLGLAFSARSWILVLMVVLVGFTYHIQILEEEKVCRAKYGISYERYLLTVPRYLLFI